jgi:hypothetical protein
MFSTSPVHDTSTTMYVGEFRRLCFGPALCVSEFRTSYLGIGLRAS